LRQIAREDQGVAIDLVRSLLGDVAVEIVDQDPRALLGQDLSRCATDAARRAFC